MRFESVPAKITLLPQGSKLGRLGTANGTNMENVWWVRKHKRLLYGLCEHPSGLHFCCKDPNWNPKWQPKEWKWKCPMVKKAQTTFLQVSRALVRITHLQQGPKLGPQGKTTGMKMETAWWIKKHKRLSCEFCAHLSGSHFCSKDPSWDPKGQSKEWKWEMSDGQKKHKRHLCEFYEDLPGSHFCRKDPSWGVKGQPKEWKWKISDGKKT